jgi:hypothetical protein
MQEAVRLKTTQVATVREQLLAQQGGKCALCGLPCKADEAVLDHDHATGAVRAALHRGCNALLGKVENNHKRYGIKSLAHFLAGAFQYLQRHTINRTGFLHPTHKSEDEKRERRNAKARAARAAKRVGAA